MVDQEIQLKYPRIQTLSLKIAVSVKCQNSLVIQVRKNKGEVIVRLFKVLFPTGLVTVYARTIEVYY